MRSAWVGVILAGVVLLAPVALVSAANPGNPTGARGSKFARQHPWRNEINKRVANQRARINQGVKSGTLTSAQAKQLAGNEKALKQQEHADVKANGGHLTKAEDKQLNQEEHADSTLIHDDKHPVAK
jgi:hypothetical protein